MTPDIRALHQDFVEAELRADTTRLDDLLAVDFASIGERGYVLDKRQWIGKFSDLSYTVLEVSDVDVRRYGSTAILRGVQRSSSVWGGTSMTLVTRVGAVWVEVPGVGWRLVALQFSSLDPALL
ncbi:hypothetical protein GCM10022223_32280 [Kineosporia mesophila]|uniref:DUF4440 domain-containing protein n=1 Tax=Kineosporia mesophila TaxID=566012 RepID=A0ABP6ZLI3_9ACTN|nr:nuclear transport factor 2 family protein [Kineosporia mesophila]MCD5354446.1 nuclear transport factor 2 family protein [Kineosporia mesophila]